MPEAQLSSKQKAALLVLSLDVEAATRIMRKLSQQEIEDLTLEITNVKGVSSHVIDNVADEFHQLIVAQQYVVQGGLDYAQQLLEHTLGFAKAADVLEKVKVLSHVTGFDMLKKADPKQLAGFLQKEHPQTIALILSNLSPEQTAQVLSEFSDELRNDVTFRISTLGKVNPALLSEMEAVLEDIAEAEISQSMSSLGGTKSVAAILNRCSTAEAKIILESIEQKNPQLAGEIKRLMFLFEDLLFVDDKGIQRILREVDKKDLAMSMKVSEDKLKQKIFSNMSERAQELLKEELQYMGPVRLKDVEMAQTRIVEIVKQLEDQGEIVVAGRGGKEEVFV
ncbi:MAG TPA: flagellar motor switch protein FliG [Bacteroidota bacterium]|nr:flagellar motor switch protein FliG [Bacteroidota bacterium]